MTDLDKQPRRRRSVAPILGALAVGRGWGRPIRDGCAGRQDRERLPGRLGQARGQARAPRQGRTGGAPGRRASRGARYKSLSSAKTAAKLTLADFKGRAVLLNLWATWCIPCRAEMPALDRLQAAKGGPGFEVVAVNVDTAKPERRAAFLDRVGVKSLARYLPIRAATPSKPCIRTARRLDCR